MAPAVVQCKDQRSSCSVLYFVTAEQRCNTTSHHTAVCSLMAVMRGGWCSVCQESGGAVSRRCSSGVAMYASRQSAAASIAKALEENRQERLWAE